MKKLIPINAASTLSDLAIWVEETKPDVIVIPKNHLLTAIWEFNPWHWEVTKHNPVWHTFRGIPIEYVESRICDCGKNTNDGTKPWYICTNCGKEIA